MTYCASSTRPLQASSGRECLRQGCERILPVLLVGICKGAARAAPAFFCCRRWTRIEGPSYKMH